MTPFEPILTETQGARLWEALQIWRDTVIEAKGKPPEFNEVNVRKSCLLGRLIYEGKPPLPDPPPRFCSAPWYGLIENGRDFLFREFYVWTHDDKVVIGQDDGWHLVERHDDGAIVVEYPRNGLWLLRDVRDDERVEGGRTIVDSAGNRLPSAMPVYYDTVLERIDG